MEISQARKPVQKRGIERQAQILAAAEAIVAESGTAEATAAAISQRAGLPTSSVYQYFPRVEMIFETIAEARFELKLQELDAAIAGRSFARWQDLLDVLVTSMCTSYNTDPVYPRLFLGLDASFVVRLGAGSRLTRTAQWACDALGRHFIVTDIADLYEPIAIAINIIDAPFHRSIALHGEIQPAYFDEGRIAVFAYLEARIGANIGAAKAVTS
ncbi:TetR/AcrR family transcriptional regulator [Arenibacterium sp. LLYu02]|uniref:TetR/AcrR family transcriptional regulator n=1 Tax=Arenibacterium sp. LLYu02 TaxID=3404132 RepID=UPI003B20F96D